MGKFFEVISYFAQASEGEEKPRTDENEYVAKAKEFIHMQYHLDINVTMIAEAVYLNRSYFSTMFKSVTGVSPLESDRFQNKTGVQTPCDGQGRNGYRDAYGI